MKVFSVLIILISFNLRLFAQENETKLIDEDKKKFEENVFNKEFNEGHEDTVDAVRKLYDKIPDKLPDWVFNPINNGDEIYMVGFSDPNMTRELAYQQAILRAKAIYALLNLSKVSNITDDYTNLKESGKYSLYTTKFQDFSLSKAQLAYNESSVTIVDTFFTKYDEGIVLIEFDYSQNDSSNLDTLTIKGEHLQVFIEKNFQKERIEFFNFFTQDNLYNDSVDYITQYNYKIVNRGYDINSLLGDSIIEFKERTYNYRTDIDFSADSTDLGIKTYRLNRGLWNAYISGVLSNITVLSKQLASQVKNSNDFYTLKHEGLIRTVARNKVSFGFNDFKMYENQLYIDLNGIIIQ
ncbi:MAG: hypothetical protein C0597_17135 [Marinilabiliales bacterium]|nr:MAG: hypothetical protein C0597_17135 [Marinilabiliales bacterium]